MGYLLPLVCGLSKSGKMPTMLINSTFLLNNVQVPFNSNYVCSNAKGLCQHEWGDFWSGFNIVRVQAKVSYREFCWWVVSNRKSIEIKHDSLVTMLCVCAMCFETSLSSSPENYGLIHYRVDNERVKRCFRADFYIPGLHFRKVFLFLSR